MQIITVTTKLLKWHLNISGIPGQLTVSIAEHFTQRFSAYVVIKRQISVI